MLSEKCSPQVLKPVYMLLNNVILPSFELCVFCWEKLEDEVLAHLGEFCAFPLHLLLKYLTYLSEYYIRLVQNYSQLGLSFASTSPCYGEYLVNTESCESLVCCITCLYTAESWRSTRNREWERLVKEFRSNISIVAEREKLLEEAGRSACSWAKRALITHLELDPVLKRRITKFRVIGSTQLHHGALLYMSAQCPVTSLIGVGCLAEEVPLPRGSPRLTRCVQKMTERTFDNLPPNQLLPFTSQLGDC
ncbi:hypothetical protein EV361DRAFT_270293 [Lentinula raphanica]|nr:hypothetical protein EV361DRAFT_270293 [Lentinula raphanica]